MCTHRYLRGECKTRYSPSVCKRPRYTMSQYATFGSLSYQPTPGITRSLKSLILAHPGPVSQLTSMYCEEIVHVKNKALKHDVWVVFEEHKEQLREAARAREAAKAQAKKAAAHEEMYAVLAEIRARNRAKEVAAHEEMYAALAEIHSRNASAEEAANRV